MRIMLVILLLLVPASAIVVKTAVQREANARERLTSDKWEYLAVAGPSGTNFSPTGNPEMRKAGSETFGREGFVLEQQLDKVGAKGWELVSVAGLPNDPVYYFKRRKP
jgi:hypothetical protein